MSEKKIDKTLLTKDAVVYSPSAEHKINGLLPQFMGCYKIIIQLWNWKCHSIQVCTFYDYLKIMGIFPTSYRKSLFQVFILIYCRLRL